MAYNPFRNLHVQNREAFPVLEFYRRYRESLKLTAHAGLDGEDAAIREVGLFRPGLALAGYTELFHSRQIQIIGHTEWGYLESIGPEQRAKVFEKLIDFRPPMWIVTHGKMPHHELVEMCTRSHVPLFTTGLYTHEFMKIVRNSLENYFAPFTKVHASLVDVFGVGMLYIGDSNVGKSECVLDLVERGHRLVADDAVNLVRMGNALLGTPDSLVGHCMEIRGVGIVDVRSMFGVHSVRRRKRVEVIVDLQIWDQFASGYDRTGLSKETETIMGIQIPRVLIPVSPGKNLTVISEVIAMNTLMKVYGEDTAESFNKRLIEKINKKRGSIPNEWDSFTDMDISQYE